MEVISVLGLRPLSGEVKIHGAKNAALPILAATIVTKGTCVLHNCPDIRDVATAMEILQYLGCKASRQGSTVTVDTTGLNKTEVPEVLTRKMRSSVIFLGALLTAAGEAKLSPPGGCVLGERPVDLHLSALEQLGARVRIREERLCCKARSLHGGTVYLRYPSVGATENLLLAALSAKEPVQLLGAAREPEVVDLAGFLNRCGAQIEGAGTGRIHITPHKLHSAEYTVVPDRMEAATYLSAAACAGGELLLKGLQPGHLRPVLDIYAAAGCRLQEEKDSLHIRCGELFATKPVVTGPYPAFPTDAQATMMAALLKAKGTTVFEERVFEDRYRHIGEFLKMGADIRIAGRIAGVRGVKQLHGADMEATDLRGGAAMLTAALGAQGKSRLTRIEHIDRGYERMTEILRSVGADITRTEE